MNDLQGLEPELDVGSQDCIRSLVSRLHVSASYEEVQAYMLKKLRPEVSNVLRTKCLDFAVLAHRENQAFYAKVMLL